MDRIEKTLWLLCLVGSLVLSAAVFQGALRVAKAQSATQIEIGSDLSDWIRARNQEREALNALDRELSAFDQVRGSIADLAIEGQVSGSLTLATPQISAAATRVEDARTSLSLLLSRSPR